MSVSSEIRLLVRQRALFACEYCGVTEADTGGELQVDHFFPQAHGGSDHADNLLYCCQRCNLYKSDYWPTQPNATQLWNPRTEPFDVHFAALTDGTLYPRTTTGSFTLQRLRLNRPPLIAYRLQQFARAKETRLFAQFRDVVAVLEQLQQQHTALLEQQRMLLEEQRALLRLLIDQQRSASE